MSTKPVFSTTAAAVSSAEQTTDVFVNQNDFASPALIVADGRASPVQTEVSEADVNEIEEALCSSPTPTEITDDDNHGTTTCFPVHRPSPAPTEGTDAADDDKDASKTIRLIRTRTTSTTSTTSTVSTQLDFDTASPETVQAKLASHGIKVRDYVTIRRALIIPSVGRKLQLYETFYPKDAIAKFDYMTRPRKGGRRQPAPGKIIAQLLEIGWITEESERLLDIDRAELVRYQKICDKKKAQFQEDHPGEIGEWGLDGKGQRGHPYRVAWKESGPEMQTNEKRGIPNRKQEGEEDKRVKKKKEGELLYSHLEDHRLGVGRPPSEKYRAWMANTAIFFWPWLGKFVRGKGMKNAETDGEDSGTEVVQPAANPRRAALGRQATLLSLGPMDPAPVLSGRTVEPSIQADADAIDVGRTPITPPSPNPKSLSLLKKASGLFTASFSSSNPAASTSTAESTNKAADESLPTVPLTASKKSRKRKTRSSNGEQELQGLRRSLRRKTKVARNPK
ncbi:hypothetical protein WG66_010604 [Moniliophthora roreri]|uniref:Uncharacterized protein n=1 Tax=Moniliophthora roreri TaxID=221103 RepID=A0A0W0FU44_MONRR|nr:hypothetical protein WG66_010604 [Moniliophthora roreri]